MKYRHIVYTSSKYVPFDEQKVVESEVLSSLFLQKLIYYNIYYDLIYIYMMLFIYAYK
jgi:hypothetical protein